MPIQPNPELADVSMFDIVMASGNFTSKRLFDISLIITAAVVEIALVSVSTYMEGTKKPMYVIIAIAIGIL